jgi:hypothetical protein
VNIDIGGFSLDLYFSGGALAPARTIVRGLAAAQQKGSFLLGINQSR